MSAKFTIEKYDGSTCDVEVDRDGSLTIYNFDLEYALSMEEFGERSDIPFQLYRDWQDVPEYFISSAFGITGEQLAELAVDYTDHAFSIMKRGCKQSYRIVSAIDLARMYFNNNADVFEIGKIYRTLQGVHSSLVHKMSSGFSAEKAIIDACWNSMGVIWASRFAPNKKARADLQNLFITASVNAADAAAYGPKIDESGRKRVMAKAMIGARTSILVRHPKNFPGWLSRREEEVSWQKRRFAHVMEADQHGLPRPEVGETQ